MPNIVHRGRGGWHLEELIAGYERACETGWLIKMLEQSLGLKGAHAEIFTELGILYSTHLPEKLIEHMTTYHGQMDIPRIVGVCATAVLSEKRDTLLHLCESPELMADLLEAGAPPERTNQVPHNSDLAHMTPHTPHGTLRVCLSPFTICLHHLTDSDNLNLTPKFVAALPFHNPPCP